jgi:hypothetical protein
MPPGVVAGEKNRQKNFRHNRRKSLRAIKCYSRKGKKAGYDSGSGAGPARFAMSLGSKG